MTDPTTPPPDLAPLIKLTRDIKNAARTLSDDEARFLVDSTIMRRVHLSPAGCWIWMGARSTAGYGLIARKHLSPVPLYVHRVMWIAKHGTIPAGLLVLHHCDTPPCVRPAHLFLGTYQDNTNDKMRKGRHRHGHLYGDDHPMRRHPEWVRRGEQHGGAKLTRQQVDIIRQRRDEPDSRLAQEYGVTRCTITAIHNNRLWKEGN